MVRSMVVSWCLAACLLAAPSLAWSADWRVCRVSASANNHLVWGVGMPFDVAAHPDWKQQLARDCPFGPPMLAADAGATDATLVCSEPLADRDAANQLRQGVRAKFDADLTQFRIRGTWTDWSWSPGQASAAAATSCGVRLESAAVPVPPSEAKTAVADRGAHCFQKRNEHHCRFLLETLERLKPAVADASAEQEFQLAARVAAASRLGDIYLAQDKAQAAAAAVEPVWQSVVEHGKLGGGHQHILIDSLALQRVRAEASLRLGRTDEAGERFRQARKNIDDVLGAYADIANPPSHLWTLAVRGAHQGLLLEGARYLGLSDVAKGLRDAGNARGAESVCRQSLDAHARAVAYQQREKALLAANPSGGPTSGDLDYLGDPRLRTLHTLVTGLGASC